MNISTFLAVIRAAKICLVYLVCPWPGGGMIKTFLDVDRKDSSSEEVFHMVSSRPGHAYRCDPLLPAASFSEFVKYHC